MAFGPGTAAGQSLEVSDTTAFVPGSMLLISELDNQGLVLKKLHLRLVSKNATTKTLFVTPELMPGDSGSGVTYAVGSTVAISGERGASGNSVAKYFENTLTTVSTSSLANAASFGGATWQETLFSNGYIGTTSGRGIFISGSLVMRANSTFAGGAIGRARVRLKVTDNFRGAVSTIFTDDVYGRVEPDWTITFPIQGFYPYGGDNTLTRGFQVEVQLSVTDPADPNIQVGSATVVPVSTRLMATEYYVDPN